MIAAHRRFDDARAIVHFAAGKDCQHDVAGMEMARLKSSPTDIADLVWAKAVGCVIGPAQMAFDRFADESTNVLLVHPRSTLSTMPIMAASTGAIFLPMASLAARPSSTMRTFS